ncbi:UNVERIFIED_CONTAM: hypothetical protein K2H54_011158 [Gekko kuhli]
MPTAVRHAEESPPASPVAPPARNLEEFAKSSTLHGINHIFQHGRYTIRHLLWTVAFLGSLGFLIHVYAERVDFYFQYPHDTALEEETVRNTAFPAVTVCNLNRLRFSQLSGHDLYWAGEFLGFLDSGDNIAAPNHTDVEVWETLSRKLEESREERSLPFNFEELHERAGHRMEQMLVECKFANKSCDASDFRTPEATCWDETFPPIIIVWRSTGTDS